MPLQGHAAYSADAIYAPRPQLLPIVCIIVVSPYCYDERRVTPLRCFFFFACHAAAFIAATLIALFFATLCRYFAMLLLRYFLPRDTRCCYAAADAFRLRAHTCRFDATFLYFTHAKEDAIMLIPS